MTHPASSSSVRVLDAGRPRSVARTRPEPAPGPGRTGSHVLHGVEQAPHGVVAEVRALPLVHLAAVVAAPEHPTADAVDVGPWCRTVPVQPGTAARSAGQAATHHRKAVVVVDRARA